ncbi:MAG: hypothetical protein RIT35_683, partial [Pseudomonadota bacterium]
ITTHDGAVLRGVRIKADEAKDNRTQQNVMVYFGGQRGCYEHYFDRYMGYTHDQIQSQKSTLERLPKQDTSDLAALANSKNMDVLMMNPRGVLDSATGTHAQNTTDLVTDGIAMVQYLLSQSTPPERIVLNGHSLGAGIATMVAAHFHSLIPPMKVNLINDRSFAQLSKVSVGNMASRAIKEICGKSLLGRLARFILGGLCGAIINVAQCALAPLMKNYNVDLDVVTAWKAIPGENKLLIYSEQDQMMKGASLHEALGSPDSTVLMTDKDKERDTHNGDHSSDVALAMSKFVFAVEERAKVQNLK